MRRLRKGDDGFGGRGYHEKLSSDEAMRRRGMQRNVGLLSVEDDKRKNGDDDGAGVLSFSARSDLQNANLC